ncbi:hypothetical protein [Acidithiobacillus albertensis]|uniref:hypothetical protein n=1 Tax=Acidithiobacillus albertensis TaxID=119978 RepID=UPI001C06C821|nr:hypothetical protein [Acidithiobacillus albertensis]MBU2741635.1 hypothetical protein [Acidithiobacillus albertensis]
MKIFSSEKKTKINKETIGRPLSFIYIETIGFITTFIFSVLAILPRLSLPYYNGKYLWGEDGHIYINQAKSLGLQALWKPYAGYLQTYSRLVALVGNMFPLKDIPSIYLLGWLISLFIAVYVMIRGLRSLQINYILIILAVMAILMQPNIGEVFFNNVDAQWLIGLALAVYLIIPSKTSQSYIGVFGSFISGISGPFSIIYLPIILYKILIEKKFRDYWLVYCFVFSGAIIQAYCIMISSRSTLHEFNYIEAIKIFFGIFYFNAHGLWIIGIIVFWLTFLIFFLQSEVKNRTISALFVLAGIGVWLASIYSANGDLSNFSGVVFGKWGDRYTFIPYSTFILAYIVVCKKNYVSYFLFSFCLLPFFYSQLTPITLSLGDVNTEYNSYVKFSHYANDVVIPNNPMIPSFPGWHIDGSYFFHGDNGLGKTKLIPSIEERFSGNSLIKIYNPTRMCKKSTYIGVEAFLFQDKSGWINTIVTPKNGKKISFSRYYPSGYIEAQFAFPFGNYSSIMMNRKGENLKKVFVYCPNLSEKIINSYFNPTATAFTAVLLNGNVPLSLSRDQSSIVGFSLPKQQLSHPMQVSSVSIFQGNYGNTADGKLAIELCTQKSCSKGSRALSQSEDNSFFTIPLKTPLRAHPNEALTLKITHVDGNKPDALWLWPENPKYPQKVVGPNGVLPGKAIRIGLKYKVQKQK